MQFITYIVIQGLFPFFYLGHFFFLCLYVTSIEIHPHILMTIYSAKVSGFLLLFHLRLTSLLGRSMFGQVANLLLSTTQLFTPTASFKSQPITFGGIWITRRKLAQAEGKHLHTCRMGLPLQEVHIKNQPVYHQFLIFPLLGSTSCCCSSGWGGR